jgi:hypothetical protein
VPWRQREGTALVEADSPAPQGWAVVAEGKDTAELSVKQWSRIDSGAWPKTVAAQPIKSKSVGLMLIF